MIDDPIFEVTNLTLRFGGVTSLADVTMAQGRGELLSVIGPNGAGKTSLFNCLTGVYRPQEGSITFRSTRRRILPERRRPRRRARGRGPHPTATPAR